MSDLREKNRAVQNCTFPSSDFSQAVREWIAAATERMEPASEPAKVECPNCGEMTSENHEVVQSDGLEGGRRLFFYTCQQRISELDDRHNRMASPEYQAKVKADMSRRAVEIGVDRLVGVSAFPVGNCPVCDELVAPWNKHAKYEGGYTCKPAQPEPVADWRDKSDESVAFDLLTRQDPAKVECPRGCGEMVYEDMEHYCQPAKVECPNCGDRTSDPHYRLIDLLDVGVIKHYTCQPAQPEPIAEEMPEAAWLIEKTGSSGLYWAAGQWSSEFFAVRFSRKQDAEIVIRNLNLGAVSEAREHLWIGTHAAQPAPAVVYHHPAAEMPGRADCGAQIRRGESMPEWNHVTCPDCNAYRRVRGELERSQPANVEPTVAAEDELDRAFDRGYEKGVLDQIARQPAPAVAMTPELEDLLDSIMSFADVDPDTQVKQIWRRKVAAVRAQAAQPAKVRMTEELETVLTLAESAARFEERDHASFPYTRTFAPAWRTAIAAVRLQAAEAGVKLPKVRELVKRARDAGYHLRPSFPEWSELLLRNADAAEAELDAHEKGEGRG